MEEEKQKPAPIQRWRVERPAQESRLEKVDLSDIAGVGLIILATAIAQPFAKEWERRNKREERRENLFFINNPLRNKVVRKVYPKMV